MSTEQLENLEQLARRVIACKRWRWMPGMRVVTEMGDAFRVEDVDFCYGELNWPKPHALLLPDLTDPATLGCLLALVREAWGPEATVSVNISGFWAVGGARIQKGKSAGHTINLGIWKLTEVDALVSALEVAP